MKIKLNENDIHYAYIRLEHRLCPTIASCWNTEHVGYSYTIGAEYSDGSTVFCYDSDIFPTMESCVASAKKLLKHYN